jgi:hypothetical protein
MYFLMIVLNEYRTFEEIFVQENFNGNRKLSMINSFFLNDRNPYL